MWAYHHRQEMDQARYQALLAKDAQLEARIKQLEGTKRDTSYTPKGMDSDLMYSDEYVEAVYNPEQPEHHRHESWMANIILKAIVFTVVLGGIMFFIWLIFIRRQ